MTRSIDTKNAHPHGRAFLHRLVNLSADLAIRPVEHHPTLVDLLPGLLARKSIFHLQDCHKFIQLVIGFIHFFQILLSHKTEPLRGLTTDQFPFFVEFWFWLFHNALFNEDIKVWMQLEFSWFRFLLSIHSPVNAAKQNCETLTYWLYYVLMTKSGFSVTYCRIENGPVSARVCFEIWTR